MKLQDLFERENLPTVKTPSVEELAKKHRVSIEKVKAALKKGTKVELEHTKKKELAQEIALDHINELLDYYDKLEKVEH